MNHQRIADTGANTPSGSAELVLTNAKIVLEAEMLEGTIQVRNGRITDVSASLSTRGEDVGGDYILPGLVELHTDHLENHYNPRPGVTWDLTAAIQAHDAQIAASGITTVFDCLRLGADENGGFEKGEMRLMSQAINAAQMEGRLRSEHFIHLRCEVSAPDVMEHYEEFEDDANVGLISLMDHAPGQRQFQTMDQYTLYYKTKRGLTETQFREFVDRRKGQSETYSARHRLALAEACAKRGIAVASHDDATPGHVEEAKLYGTTVAEFPTSMEAARASHEAGMGVLMGAPNVVRGKSHSGNIAARELAENGVLDILSSDYVPLSLIHAPFVLSQAVPGISLSHAVAMVSANPARQVGLSDRGSIAMDKKADLVRISRIGNVPAVRSVWRDGLRVV